MTEQEKDKPLCILAGYFGYGNAGDELIHQTLRQHVTSVRWSVLWPSDAPSPDGVETVDRWSVPELTRTFKRAKALVLGGGELFQARTSFRSLLYYVALIQWAKICGCEIWAFGLGMDPNLNRFGRWLGRWALSGVSGLWVRDQRTRQVLKSIRSAVKINLSPDPVWAWKTEQQTLPSASDPKRILWILRSVGDPAEREKLSAILNDLGARSHFENNLLCLHPALDLSFLTGLRSRLRFFHRLETWTRAEELPEIFQRYDAVVTMRFHGIVLANLSGRAAVALSGHGKVAQLAAETSSPIVDWERADASSLEHAILNSQGAGVADAQDRGDAARHALAELAAGLSVR